jgi:hypothetical protein
MEFQGCYLHPSRPAVRKCLNCERPICKLCEEESGDPLFCLPCKEELEKTDESVVVPFTKDDLAVAEKRRTPFDVGEVTIFGDGRVVAPEEEPAKPVTEEAPVSRRTKPDEGTTTTGTREKPARVKHPLPDELKRAKPPRPPSAEELAREKAEKRAALYGRIPGARKAAAVKDSVEEMASKAATAIKPAFERPAEEAEKPEPARPSRQKVKREKTKRVKREWNGPVPQMFSGMFFGLIAAVVLSVAWLVFAFLARQWSQVVVLTLGIVVPWASYKGMTVRKRHGKRIWDEPLQPLWIGIPSLILVTAIAVPLQLAAFQVIYGANTARLPFSDFMDRFFGPIDWVLLALGLGFAFFTPYLLERWGADWKKSARRRDGKPGGEDADETEAGKKAESSTGVETD